MIPVTTASAQSQAQKIPRAERAAVHRYANAHKKQSSLDKFWSSVKNTLGIK